ncbi:interleukin-10 receptor subunit beta-like isoform X3 [Gouania willdenowi]|uniref:interleukin-10 receptor subunit beta-like isoform X3 n=1 Tax=Gouania willdenowi TaxID=441366 RepID=UPI0010541913|nr:interleukin-10 receptor subunit beta-like isoform X3 [Gouania willdenowi]
MSGSLYAYFPMILAVGVCTGPSAILSPPTNIRLNSYNMNLVLSWDPPLGGPLGLYYNAEYKSSVSTYRTGCVNISTLECDFSSENISVYGTYTSRVRAQYGVQSSAWGQSNNITLDKDTLIGPPSVSLFSNGAVLEVDIKDPVFTISNLRNVYHLATYNVSYWKQGQDTKEKMITQLHRMPLNHLNAWSQYCVQVQINTYRNLNPGKPSNITCESTTNPKDEAPWLPAVLVFVAVVITSVIVAIVIYWKCKSQLTCPKNKLLEDFRDLMQSSTDPTMYIAMKDLHPIEELFDQVSIIAADKTVTACGSPQALRANCSTVNNQKS